MEHVDTGPQCQASQDMLKARSGYRGSRGFKRQCDLLAVTQKLQQSGSCPGIEVPLP